MAKKLNILTSLALGIAGGAAAAVFLATESGKKVKEKVSSLVKDYQENPDSVHADLVMKAQGLKDQAVDKYTEVKNQFESGELTLEDVVDTGKQKVQEFASQVRENLSESENLEDSVTEEEILVVTQEDIVVQDDIEINL